MKSAGHPDDVPTREDAPSAASATVPQPSPSASGPRADNTSGATGSVDTAMETMHVQEVARTRSMMRLCCVLALVGIPNLFVLRGDPLARRVYLVSLVLVAMSTAAYSWVLQTDEGYTNTRTLFVGALAIAAAFSGIYYFGVFSAATAVLPFGVYFFSSSQHVRSTFVVYGAVSGMYLLLALLVASGLMRDRGILANELGSNYARIILAALLETILLLSFVIAHVSRGSAIAAIHRHDVVIKRLAQRDALLQEAKQELDRALNVAGLGRFSDTTVGSFKLGAVIGRGAMGEVYSGTNMTTGSRAAVKLLHTHVLANADIVKRFLREAKIAASLDVPNVVKVLEIGDLTSPFPFIAMEQLEGEDLADHLRQHRQLSPRRVSRLLRQIGQGLLAAHRAGIVHRDLKPRNIFLARIADGEVWKILDFGVSKLAGADEALTQDHIVGTPEYMAPEQATNKPVTGKADFYSLGVIAYRALTGRPAFVGANVPEILLNVMCNMPPRPSDVAPLHEDVSLVLAIALAKAPEDRFDTVDFFANALDAAALGKLEPALRSKAEALLANNPWGTATRG